MYIVSYRIGWFRQEFEKDKLNIMIGDVVYSEIVSFSCGWYLFVENDVMNRLMSCDVNVLMSGK